MTYWTNRTFAPHTLPPYPRWRSCTWSREGPNLGVKKEYLAPNSLRKRADRGPTCARVLDLLSNLCLPSTRDEARALSGLVERGSATAETIRELIEVSLADVQRLREIAEIEPEAAHCAPPALRFRRHVLRELNRLADGQGIRDGSVVGRLVVIDKQEPDC